MFAYCNNNPVFYSDPSGHFLRNDKLYRDTMLTYGGGSGSGSSRVVITPGKSPSQDPLFVGYDNRRSAPKKSYHEQAFIIDATILELALPGFADDGYQTAELIFVQASAQLISGGWEFEGRGEIKPFELFSAEASASLGPDGFNVSAMAALWQPSFTYESNGRSITVTLNFCSLGGELAFGSGNFKFGKGGLFGWSVELGW